MLYGTRGTEIGDAATSFVTEEENKWLKYNYGMLFALVQPPARTKVSAEVHEYLRQDKSICSSTRISRTVREYLRQRHWLVLTEAYAMSGTGMYVGYAIPGTDRCYAATRFS
eukprot:1381590-Rhodomonas_salina.2